MTNDSSRNPLVKNCIIFPNGMVASFDDKGGQIPACQGFILDIADKLKNCCDENTKWQLGVQDADFAWYWMKEKESEKD